MEKKYNLNDVKQKIRDLIQQTLQEDLEAELENSLDTPNMKGQKMTTTETATSQRQ